MRFWGSSLLSDEYKRLGGKQLSILYTGKIGSVRTLYISAVQSKDVHR